MDEQIEKKNRVIDFLKTKIKVISAIVFISIFLISILSWTKYKGDLKKTDLSENYIQAKIMLSKKKPNEALNILEKIIQEEDSTYSILSLYLVIDQNLYKDDKVILSYFDKVLSINSLQQEDLDLLKFKKAVFISKDGNEEELLNLLNPIINSKSVWKTQSIKFLADFYYSRKEHNKADQYYSTLLNLENSNIDKNEIKRKIKTYKK